MTRSRGSDEKQRDMVLTGLVWAFVWAFIGALGGAWAGAEIGKTWMIVIVGLLLGFAMLGACIKNIKAALSGMWIGLCIGVLIWALVEGVARTWMIIPSSALIGGIFGAFSTDHWKRSFWGAWTASLVWVLIWALIWIVGNVEFGMIIGGGIGMLLGGILGAIKGWKTGFRMPLGWEYVLEALLGEE